MLSTTSRDGTDIAYERTGEGPPVVLVFGAFNDRGTGADLVARLAGRSTVFSYDRRGRGDSGDVAPYDVEREIDDLESMLRAAGGAAPVLGYSSGAVLALRAAARGLPITKLALYDTPPAQASHHAAELAALLGAGRRGDAVEYFQLRMVGIPEDVVARLRHAPFRPALEAMAHTLVYEAMIMDYGPRFAALVAGVRPPTLAIAGGAGAPAMREVAEALARSLPDGKAIILPGATHDLDPALLGPVLERFWLG
jgi:pimeloyl-ACP methyl ester carboxylesterase